MATRKSSAAAGKAAQAKAAVQATEAKVHDINERRTPAPSEPTRKADRPWFAKLTPAAKQAVRECVTARLESGETLSKAWAHAIYVTKQTQTTDARKAGIEARAAARRQGVTPKAEEAQAIIDADRNPETGERPSETAMRLVAEQERRAAETITDPVPPTPPAPEPTTKRAAATRRPAVRIAGDRATLYAKAIAAKQQAKAEGRHRKGEPVTDEQLGEYIANVRRVAPEAIASREMEIASWIGGMAFSPARWRSAWASAAKRRAS